tara:strand:- start:671 stop:799 length:129 start_codon:yes stop_codon:yes gene_type:complete
MIFMMNFSISYESKGQRAKGKGQRAKGRALGEVRDGGGGGAG